MSARVEERDFSMEDVVETLESLESRANDGDASAMLTFGSRLLVGAGCAADPMRGKTFVVKAAEARDPEALNLLATLTAAGAWTMQSWPEAVRLLQLAAERGSVDAADQWRIISRGGNAPNLETFVMPPSPEVVLDAPRIWRANGFATPEECVWIIERARGRLSPAKMYDRGTHKVDFDAIRTNSDYFFNIAESGVLLVLLRIRLSLLVSLPVPNMEPPQVLHYIPGQELRAHFDFLGEKDDFRMSTVSASGDRVVTFLLALNDEYDGGETEFTRAKFRWRGRTGDALFFANLRSGTPDLTTLHAGRPISRGEKWLLSQWIRERPFALVDV